MKMKTKRRVLHVSSSEGQILVRLQSWALLWAVEQMQQPRQENGLREVLVDGVVRCGSAKAQ